MSSTLDACFKSAEEAANVSVTPFFRNIPLIVFQDELETKKEELATEEAEMSDLRERLDAQCAIEFYDELGTELASRGFLKPSGLAVHF